MSKAGINTININYQKIINFYQLKSLNMIKIQNFFGLEEVLILFGKIKMKNIQVVMKKLQNLFIV